MGSVEDLERSYRGYLDALNERRFGDLDRFVHDEVTHNGRLLTREGYAAMIADDVDRIPDLRFVADLLVTRGDLLACRLLFDCTLAKEFAGVPVTGRPVRFAEHVVYRFRAGRIERVWSLVDTEAAREQSGVGAGAPSLRVEIFPADLDRTVAFYERLGFTVDGRSEGPPRYAALRLGSVRIGAAESAPVDPGLRGVPAGTEIVIEVEDVQSVRDAVVATGITPTEDLVERPWGLTDVRFTDPDGYYLRFTSVMTRRR